jgi:hypothetical protein
VKKETKLTEKAARIPDIRETRFDQAIVRYLREVEAFTSKPAMEKKEELKQFQ